MRTRQRRSRSTGARARLSGETEERPGSGSRHRPIQESCQRGRVGAGQYQRYDRLPSFLTSGDRGRGRRRRRGRAVEVERGRKSRSRVATTYALRRERAGMSAASRLCRILNGNISPAVITCHSRLDLSARTRAFGNLPAQLSIPGLSRRFLINLPRVSCFLAR